MSNDSRASAIDGVAVTSEDGTHVRPCHSDPSAAERTGADVSKDLQLARPAWDWAVVGPLPPERRELLEQIRRVLPEPMRGVVAASASRHEALDVAVRARVTVELPGDAAIDVHLRRDVALAGGLVLEHAPDGATHDASYSTLDELRDRVATFCGDDDQRARAARDARARALATPADGGPFFARRVTHDDLALWVRTEQGGDEDVVREVVVSDAYRLRALAGLDVRTIVDVGGHIGAFTALAKRVWPDAQVHVLEPNPRSCELLRHNVGQLPGVTVHQAAVRYDGADVLTASVRSTGSGFMAHRDQVQALLAPNFQDRLWRCRTVGRVPTVTLEQLVGDRPIDLLKLDCEGSEHDILAHASDALLARVGVIVGEFHDAEGCGRFEALLRRRLPHHEVEIERGKAIGIFTCMPRGLAGRAGSREAPWTSP